MSSPRASSQASATCAMVQSLGARDLLDRPEQIEVALEIALLEARMGVPPVGGIRSSRRLKAPERKPRPSGQYGDQPDAELADSGRISVLDVARPQRIFASPARRSDGPHGRAGWSPGRPRTGRGSAPCPARRAATWRPPSPRSARPGRRGAGSRGRSRRCRAASGSPRRPTGTYSGLPLTPPRSPFGPRTLPNFDAMISLSRLPLMRAPSSSSFLPAL